MSAKHYPHALRKQLGLTLEAFANLIQCSVGHLSMAESGKRTLPPQSLVLLDLLAGTALEAEKTTQLVFENEADLQALLDKRINATAARQEQLELMLKETSEQVVALLNFLKTAALWMDKTLPPGSEEALLQMQILQRKVLKKWKQQVLAINSMQLTMAGLSAELAEAQRKKNIERRNNNK